MQHMIDYVRRYIEARDPIATKLDTRFPFRRLADHCYRTYRWAQRINALEGADAEIVEIGALFHDIGKCVDNTSEGHAVAGAGVCRDYLRSMRFDPEVTETIVHLVATHTHSIQDPAISLEARVVRDADLLDEVGALTVLWDAMAAGAEPEQSYLITYERIRTAYLRRRERDLLRFETETGQRYCAERLGFLRRFVENLEYELGLSSTFQSPTHGGM
jgi:uncharacterized protein